ncbi:MAG: hypothetical protein IKY33_01015 [Clostridia bacterium]|nr:hypothetical protein [Clostridia bacterium]
MSKRVGTIIGIVVGILAALAAVGAVLYWLDKKGTLKLKKTDFTYSEEFPDEEEEAVTEA